MQTIKTTLSKPFIKAVCKVVLKKANPIYEGYEMGLLISSEFTPDPDFSSLTETVRELCLQYQVSFTEFLTGLNKLGNACSRCDWSIYNETQMLMQFDSLTIPAYEYDLCD